MKLLLIGLLALGSISAFAEKAPSEKECFENLYKKAFYEASKQPHYNVDPQTFLNTLDKYLEKVDVAAKEYCRDISI